MTERKLVPLPREFKIDKTTVASDFLCDLNDGGCTISLHPLGGKHASEEFRFRAVGKGLLTFVSVACFLEKADGVCFMVVQEDADDVVEIGYIYDPSDNRWQRTHFAKDGKLLDEKRGKSPSPILFEPKGKNFGRSRGSVREGDEDSEGEIDQQPSKLSGGESDEGDTEEDNTDEENSTEGDDDDNSREDEKGRRKAKTGEEKSADKDS